MESWFHRFGWSCCSRTKPPNSSEPGSGTALPETPQPYEDLHSLPTLPNAHSPSDIRSEEETPQLGIPQEQRSARSTVTALGSSAVDAASLMLGKVYTGQMRCIGCEEPATGFCAGCPSKRYCFGCYEVHHKGKMSGLHRYCSYSARQVITKKTRKPA